LEDTGDEEEEDIVEKDDIQDMGKADVETKHGKDEFAQAEKDLSSEEQHEAEREATRKAQAELLKQKEEAERAHQMKMDKMKEEARKQAEKQRKEAAAKEEKLREELEEMQARKDLDAKDRALADQSNELTFLRKELLRTHDAKSLENSTELSVTELRIELAKRDSEISRKDDDLKRKDASIVRLRADLHSKEAEVLQLVKEAASTKRTSAQTAAKAREQQPGQFGAPPAAPS